jgi:PqqD family protein of HPr-rel-A system
LDILRKDSAIWGLPHGAKLRWRGWEPSEVIVYNCASGQSHLLDAFSAAALRAIAAEPQALDRLCSRLANELDLDDEVVMARLVQVSATFEQLGLAEPNSL